MPPETAKLLEDIRDAGEFILARAAALTLEQFESNRVVRQAVERNFEIIGEAMVRLRDRDPSAAGRLGNPREIIAFRNVLVHGYDAIDYAVVWDVIRFKLPELVNSVQRLLAESPK